MSHAGADTIFAVASGIGRAALTVLRVSGPDCASILLRVCGRLPVARRASLRSLRGPNGVMLDRALVLWFPGPASYSGEDCCELHLHGGAAVLDGVVSALASLGARPAEAGEFTRRAVIHGRMDLLEAEAIADLVEAETGLQRDQALRQMGGALGTIYAGWAARLLRLLAQQEALIDFPDEDLPAEVEDALQADIAALADEMRDHLAKGGMGERLRTGLVYAIVGAPNAGKSTLINLLCQREVAIVSPQPGTTRDVVEARLEIAGVPVTLSDTAGLREGADAIEAEGIRRARVRMAEADLVIALHEPGMPDVEMGHARVISICTKIDLLDRAPDGPAISALSGAGIAALWSTLEAETRRLAGLSGEPVLTRARHRVALMQAVDHLSRALDRPWPELRGEELRLAVRALGRLTGAVGVEDVLDSVFGQFCIGK